MDHNVAEYLQRVPVSLKIRGMTSKYILREAVKDVVTKTGLGRRGVGRPADQPHRH